MNRMFNPNDLAAKREPKARPLTRVSCSLGDVRVPRGYVLGEFLNWRVFGGFCDVLARCSVCRISIMPLVIPQNVGIRVEQVMAAGVGNESFVKFCYSQEI